MKPVVRTLVALAALAGATVAALVTTAAPVAAAPGEQCFVIGGYSVFLDREARDEEVDDWLAAFAAGTSRFALPQHLATSDEWLRVEVTKLYRQALDRGPSEPDLVYWTSELRRGAKVTRIASLIFGAPEFAARAGGTIDAVITDMYARILHRAPGDGELAYWVAQAEVDTRGSIAADLVFAPESRTDRVTVHYRAILGRAPDATGLAYWVDRLRSTNDVQLAVGLASSPEFFARSQDGCSEPPPPPAGTFAITGRGWGHGRGMSQWGALGYAVEHGWSTDQIVAHYYGGTTAGSVPDTTQRVYLVGSAGTDLDVTQPAARLQVDGWSGVWGAVSVRRLTSTTYRVYASTSTGCSPSWTLLGDTSATDVAVRSSVAQGDDASRMVTDCRSGRAYRGVMHNVRTGGSVGSAVVNEVGTEALLRGIVPLEVSPSWANLGGGTGAAAVRAQAIAARSYLMAGDTRWGGWATTCDSTACQAYRGFSAEDSRTNAAVTMTAGQVRRLTSGAVARAEFASSSGGWTAGGTFPAVVDEGDDHPSNAYHSWSVTLTAGAIERAYPGRGPFLRFEGFVRNGKGDLGGRVTTVRLVFSSGAVTQTGEQFRSALGLKSDWWAVA